MFTQPAASNGESKAKSDEDLSDWTNVKLKFTPDKVCCFPLIFFFLHLGFLYLRWHNKARLTVLMLSLLDQVTETIVHLGDLFT